MNNDYDKYLEDNPSIGYLNIRAYAANEALPIENLEVTVSKEINNKRFTFYKGKTDSSGTIRKIELPTKTLNPDDEVDPTYEEYDVVALYNNNELIFKVRIYENIEVLQNISIVPNLRLDGSLYGS